MGNSFGDPSSDLIVLDTRDVANSSVVSTVDKVNRIGQDSFEALLKGGLSNEKLLYFAPINKNNLALFSKPITKKSDNNVSA